jgi:3-hydroxyacyl-[acyl-carrier-protein] dehydratase
MGSVPDMLAHLPHAEPFRFLSELVELQPGVRGRGVWAVRGTEDFFRGHFPGRPLVPGVLLLEAMAQLSGLVGLHNGQPQDHGRGGRLVHSDVRFDAPVSPPARVMLESALERSFGSLRQFEVSASVGGARVARGTLTLAEASDQTLGKGTPG